MKDYSKYFEYPEAFIKSINIKDNEIEVIFSSGVTNVYSLTRENVKSLYNQLELQYKEVSENWRKIIKGKKFTIDFLIILSTTILAALAAYGISTSEISYLLVNNLNIITPIAITGLALTDGIIINGVHNKINGKNKKIQEIINNFDQLQGLLDTQEENIKRGLTPTGDHALNSEKALVDEGLYDDVININLLDKFTQKEINHLYNQYKIEEGLQETPKVLTRRKTPNQK